MSFARRTFGFCFPTQMLSDAIQINKILLTSALRACRTNDIPTRTFKQLQKNRPSTGFTVCRIVISLAFVCRFRRTTSHHPTLSEHNRRISSSESMALSSMTFQQPRQLVLRVDVRDDVRALLAHARVVHPSFPNKHQIGAGGGCVSNLFLLLLPLIPLRFEFGAICLRLSAPYCLCKKKNCVLKQLAKHLLTLYESAGICDGAVYKTHTHTHRIDLKRQMQHINN